MTRFARAKGSKASNERLPEEATSWNEMKQQLLEKIKEIEESNNRKEIMSQRNANYKAFLDKMEEDKSKISKWADFSEISQTVQCMKKTVVTQGKKVANRNYEFTEEHDVSEDDEEFTLLKNKVDDILVKVAKLNIVEDKVEANNLSDSDEPPEEKSAKKEIVEPLIKVKKHKKKKSLKIIVDKEKEDVKGNESDKNEGSKITKKKRKAEENAESTKSKKIKTIEESVPENNNKTKHRKNKKGTEKIKQKNKVIKEDLTEKDLKKIEKKKLKRLKQVEKKKKAKAELKIQKETGMSNEQEQNKVEDTIDETASKPQTNVFNKNDPTNNFSSKKPFNVNKSNNFNGHEKKAKIKNGEKPQRKKPYKMFIHDKEVKIDYVEGFPIKKEDAERLKQLKKEMISKGLPRSEINVALKLERRRAERTLANLKKKACFHCRKSGHNLSECPELDKNEIAQTAGYGICFKCGSTEHTHFECKVVRGQEFKFAQCFICQEQGHISRQCPDNARGLYPKGGACHVCGDVTHLKRDCPRYQVQQQRQEDSLKIETFGGGNPDVLEESSGNVILSNKTHKPNKIIKF